MLPLTWTSASDVTVRPDIAASVLICPAGRSTATPPTRSRRFLSRPPTPFATLSAVGSPPVLWTITWRVFVGVLSAFARRPGATYVPFPAAAAPVTGTNIVNATTVTASADFAPVRPHVVLPREPPPGPLPQSVL